MTQVSGLRRFWPQKVRTRLTVIYTGLFLSGGIVLLGLTYLLVAKNLPLNPPAGKPPMTMNDFIKLCKHPRPVKTPASKPAGHSPMPSALRSPKLSRECAAESAYLAGSKLAALNQR